MIELVCNYFPSFTETEELDDLWSRMMIMQSTELTLRRNLVSFATTPRAFFLYSFT